MHQEMCLKMNQFEKTIVTQYGVYRYNFEIIHKFIVNKSEPPLNDLYYLFCFFAVNHLLKCPKRTKWSAIIGGMCWSLMEMYVFHSIVVYMAPFCVSWDQKVVQLI